MKTFKKIGIVIGIIVLLFLVIYIAYYYLILDENERKLKKAEKIIEKIDSDLPLYHQSVLVQTILEDSLGNEDVLGKDEVKDHKELGKEYIIPTMIIYTDNYKEGSGYDENFGGVTRRMNTIDENSFTSNLYLRVFNDDNPDIQYVMPNTKFKIIKVFPSSYGSYVYILEDENGTKSWKTDIFFEGLTERKREISEIERMVLNTIEKGKDTFLVRISTNDRISGAFDDESEYIWLNPFSSTQEKTRKAYRKFKERTDGKYESKITTRSSSFPIVRMILDTEELLFMTLFNFDTGIAIDGIKEDTDENYNEMEKILKRTTSRTRSHQLIKEEKAKIVEDNLAYFIDEKGYIRIHTEKLTIKEEDKYKGNVHRLVEDIKLEANFLNTAIIDYGCSISKDIIHDRDKYMAVVNNCINNEKGFKEHKADQAWLLHQMTYQLYKTYDGIFANKEFDYPFYSFKN